MSVFFRRLTIRWPDSVQPPTDWDGCWKIYTICTAANKGACTTIADVRDCSSKDRKDARSSYISFVNKGHTGQNLSDLYDDKQCHEAHSFKMDGKEIKVLRIWGSGVIRIYFCYLGDKNIVILKTWPKRKDRLSDGEKLQLEDIARRVLKCLKTNTFDSRVI